MENFGNRRKILKTKFQNREIIFGGWLSYPEISIAETFSEINLDFLVIDMEHSSISLEQAKNIILASHSKNKPCLPRQVSHTNNFTKPLLEFGSDGMFFPMVNNTHELKKIINDFKYPPKGLRSFGLNRAQDYGFHFDEYIQKWNETSTLILQIESREGVENIESLISNDAVDGVMIGPYDLSGSYGHPGILDHKDVINACEKIINCCNKYKKSCGTQITDVSKSNINKQIDFGYNFIILSSDLFVLWKWSESLNKTIQEIK